MASADATLSRDASGSRVVPSSVVLDGVLSGRGGPSCRLDGN